MSTQQQMSYWVSFVSDSITQLRRDPLTMFLWIIDDLAAQIYTALSDLVPARPNPRPARAIKYSRRVNLAFSLLNEDSTLGGGAFDWDIEAAIASEPHLD
jgi:hypothetical protein